MDVYNKRMSDEKSASVQKSDTERLIETHVMTGVLIERMGDLEEKVGGIHKRLYENGLVYDVRLNTMFRKWSLRSIGAVTVAAFGVLLEWWLR